jgi:hypothetical protein
LEGFRYPDHICNFPLFEDKCRIWQDIIYSFGLGEMPGRVPSTTGRGGFSLKIVKGAKINKDK